MSKFFFGMQPQVKIFSELLKFTIGDNKEPRSKLTGYLRLIRTPYSFTRDPTELLHPKETKEG